VAILRRERMANIPASVHTLCISAPMTKCRQQPTCYTSGMKNKSIRFGVKWLTLCY